LRRISIINYALDFKGKENVDTWKWLKKLVETLGSDGMSSEESVVEGQLQKSYRTKILPWRRDVNKALSMIDDARWAPSSGFAPQGSKPVPRERHPSGPISMRPLVI
jgi:hypothetical protein